MSYTSHFLHADEIIAHLNTIIPTITDDLLKAKYVGFVAVASATVYEVAIKDIFISFAKSEHNILGNLMASKFERINGKIDIETIKNDYIKPLGADYLDRFKVNLELSNNAFLQINRRDFKSSYKNLILTRHQFAHVGQLLGNSTYPEIVQAYEDGKEVIKCLSETMLA